MRFLAIALLYSFLCLPAVVAGMAPGYMVIKDTTSPNQRYAVAWGLPGRKVDWNKVQAGDVAELIAMNDFDDEVENYIVDLKEGKVLQTIGSGFWSLSGTSYANRRSLEVRWTPDSDVALVLYSWRFYSGFFVAYRINPGGKLDLREPVEKAFRDYLLKAFPAKYRKSEAKLAIRYDDLQPQPAGDFTVKGHAEIPKNADEEYLAESALIRFSVEKTGKQGLKLSRIEVELLKEEVSAAEAEGGHWSKPTGI